MSNTNNNLQTQTSSALHNAIIEAGGKDRPPMLAAAIERLKQGESINVQDLGTNLYWECGKFTSRDCESLDSYYSRFVTLVKQREELKTVSYHKLYDILKQHHNEVNEIRAERLAHTANALALIAQQQPVYYPQPNPTHYTQKLEVVVNDEASSKENEIDKLMTLISMSFKKIYKPTNSNLRTSSNTRNINVDNTPISDRRTGYDRQTGQYDNQRAVNVVGARENIDDEPEDHELEAHYMYMAKIQEQPESINDIYLVEQDDNNITPESSDMSNNKEEADQDDQMLQKERELLASLIEQMKIEIDGKQTKQ
ncbi:hypothetical protein Tco_0530937 [Tanacetum coccineum]